MTTGLTGFDTKKWKSYADWKLLVLLLLFLNVKLAIKIPVIVLVYAWQFDFRFKFRLKDSRLPLFYLLVIVLPVLAIFINGDYKTPGYLPVLFTGIFFWLLCILAIHQVKLSVEGNSTITLHRTLWLFFIVNAAVTAGNLLVIMYQSGAVNPYTYQGEYQKYFISTGDYIKGLTFDTSTTNAVINAMGVLYFLTRKNIVMLMVCMAALLLTGSNFINIVLLLISAGLFAFKSDRDQKSMVLICVMFLVVFMAKISPQNNRYVAETFKDTFARDSVPYYASQNKTIPIEQQPDSLLNPEERRVKFATLYLDSLSKAVSLTEKKSTVLHSSKPLIINNGGRILLPQPDIDSAPYQNIKTPMAAEQPLISFIYAHKHWLPISGGIGMQPQVPGKALGLLQTLKFYAQNPSKILLGAGMGNFSSKLAFRTTGLGFAGGFPQKDIYIDRDFMRNHLDLYLNFFSKQHGYHSLTNSPFSVYDQLLAEYGLFGLLAFAIFYWGFFAKHYKTLTYGLPVLALITAALFIDYWFEQLSVLILFELLLLLNIKETNPEITGGPVNV